MIHKVPSTDLQPGMYVVDLGLAAQDFPLVYARDGLLSSAQEIEQIRSQGYRDAFVDDKKSTVPVQSSMLWDDLFMRDMPFPGAKPKAKPTDVKQKLQQAIVTYASSIQNMRHVFSRIQAGGSLPMDEIYETTGKIVRSIADGSPMLTVIGKLQSFDEYTFTHSVNVSVMTAMFAAHLGSDADTVYNAALAGLLHDIGKLSVPRSLLMAPRKLTDSEFALLRKHAAYGYNMIKASPDIPQSVKQGIREHHERYNGSGYPDGKQGEDISQLARLLSIVDVYDALTSKRVYKPALTPYTSVAFLYSQRGEIFDVSLIEHFIQCVGIYPAGSIVRLNTGESGVVYQNNPQKPLRPMVGIVMDSQGLRCSLKLLDLLEEDDISIVESLEPQNSPITIPHVLAACALAEREQNADITRKA